MKKTLDEAIEVLREAWNAAEESIRADERVKQLTKLQEVFAPPKPDALIVAAHAARTPVARAPKKDGCHADTLSGLPCKLHAVGTYHRRAMCGIHMHHARRRREERG